MFEMYFKLKFILVLIILIRKYLMKCMQLFTRMDFQCIPKAVSTHSILHFFDVIPNSKKDIHSKYMVYYIYILNLHQICSNNTSIWQGLFQYAGGHIFKPPSLCIRANAVRHLILKNATYVLVLVKMRALNCT